MPLMQKKMDDESPGAFNGSDGAYARRVGEVAMAFDLGYNYFPNFSRKSIAYFTKRAHTMIFNANSITAKVNWAPNSNYSGHLNGAAGMAALIIDGSKGDAPVKPRPFAHQHRTITATGTKNDAPVSPLYTRQSRTKLALGGINPQQRQ